MTSLIPWGGGRGWTDPFSTDLWDPFTRRPAGQDETSAIAHASVDWRETDTAHVFTAELPGVRREEVKVEVEGGNVLRISGERTKEEEEDDVGDTWHRVERRRGRFMRRFRLPNNVDMEGIKCALDHGVLTVTVPKVDVGASATVRAIDIA